MEQQAWAFEVRDLNTEASIKITEKFGKNGKDS